MLEPTTCHLLNANSVDRSSVQNESPNFLSRRIIRQLFRAVIQKIPTWLIMLSGFFMSDNVLEAQCPNSGLFITEFVYDVCATSFESTGGNEYFVLTNTGSSIIDLNGAQFDDDGNLSDGNGLLLSSSTLNISPGECMIVTSAPQANWEAEYGLVSATGCTFHEATGTWQGLNNGGDNIGVTGACNNGSYGNIAGPGEVVVWNGTNFVNGGVVSIHADCGPQTYIPGTLSSCPVASIEAVTRNVCQADTSIVKIPIVISGGTGPFTVEHTVDGVSNTTVGISNGDNILVAGPTAGAATVKLTSVVDNFGMMCTGTVGTEEASVNIRPAPFARLTGTTASTSCTPCNGTVTFSGSNPNPVDIDYTVDGVAQSVTDVTLPYTLMEACPGSYIVTGVKDDFGCVGSFLGSGTVGNATTVSIENFGVCIGSSATATVTGTPATTDAYVSADPTIASVTQAGLVSGIKLGSTTITFTNSDGCQATATVTVEALPPCIISGGVELCSGDAINLTETDSGRTGGQWDWTGPNGFTFSSSAGGITIPNATVSNAGTYTVTVTDIYESGAMCNSSCAVDVTVNPLPTANISTSTNPCASEAVTLTVTGGEMYHFFNDLNGNNDPDSGENLQASSTTNSYTSSSFSNGDEVHVIVTDSKGCFSVISTVLTINENPSCTIVTSPTDCGASSGSATINVSSGTAPYTYVWNNGSASSMISGLAAGAYSVVVTDANGCTSSCSAIVLESSPPTISIITTPTACGENNGSVVTNISGGAEPYAYLWSNSATTGTISNLEAGTYSVTVTDSNNCMTSSSATIDNSNGPSCTTSSTASGCTVSNGSASVSVVGGLAPYSYVWSNGATTASNTEIAAGSYFVTVSDDNSCATTCSVTVSTSSAPMCTTSSTSTSCGEENGGVTVTASSGVTPYTYAWSDGSTTARVSDLVSGSYAVTVTDANGCTTTCSASVGASSAPMCTTSSTSTSCGEDNGGVTVTAGSSVAPYTYAWSNGSSTALVSDLASGSYAVTVTDANGCTTTCTASVGASSAPTCTTSSTSTSCGEENGGVTVTASSGVAPYTYAWSNGSSTASVSDLASDSYIVTVTDANGCTTTCSASVGASSASTCTTSSTSTSCGEDNGSVAVTASGGATPYSYAWSNGSTTANVSDLASGSYAVTVTDANGCTATCSTSVGASSAPTCTTSSTSTSCGEDNGGVIVTANSGVAPYTYVWSNGSSTASVSDLASGSYAVTATDANGCITTCLTSVGASSAPTCTTSSTSTSCGEDNGSVTVTASGGATPYTYAWSNGSSTASVSDLAAGSYSVTVSDTNGCQMICEAIVASSTVAPATIEDIVVCEGASSSDIILSMTNSDNENLSHFKLNFDSAAESSGFTDQSSIESLSAASIALPDDLGPGIYSGEICLVYDNFCQVIDPFTITVVAEVEAGEDAMTTLCNDDASKSTVILFDELGGNPDGGGVWTETSTGTASGATVSESNGSVDFTGVVPGDYEFTYSVAATTPCHSQSSKVTVTVEKCRVDDVAISKSLSSAGPFMIGDKVTFTLTIMNEGTHPIYNVRVSDYLSTALDFVASDNSGNDFSSSPDTNGGTPLATTVATTNPILSGETYTLSIVLTINSNATMGGDIINNAEIIGATEDAAGNIPIQDSDNPLTSIGSSTSALLDQDDFDMALLRLCNGLTATVDSPVVCKGTTSAPINLNVTEGVVEHLQIFFDPEADAAGFDDVVLLSSPYPTEYVIPATIGEGVYNGVVVLWNDMMCATSVPFTITVECPDCGEFPWNGMNPEVVATNQCGSAYIAGVIDGPLAGGTPKAIEICASSYIPDLSQYGIGSANNGEGSDGEEFTFPAVSLLSGDCVTITNNAAQFESYFDCPPDFTSSVATINGDDAIELYCSGVVVDLFGDIDTDGNGECWEYLDGWAYRNNQSANDGVFSCNAWTFSGANALDGEASNSTAASEYPGVTCEPLACEDLIIEAFVYCSNDANDLDNLSYYVEVSAVRGSMTSGSFDVTVGGSTQVYSGTSLSFGPYAHSGVGNTFQLVSAVDNSMSSCSGSIEVAETYCVDLDEDGVAENDYAECDCIAASVAGVGGTIVTQSAPGSFSSGFLINYLLLDANTGAATVVASNPIGHFTNLPEGTFYAYAVSYDQAAASNVSAILTAGSTVDVEALSTSSAPFDNDCYTVCGPSAYSITCGSEQVNLACNDKVNVSVDSNCNASLLGVDQLLEGNITDNLSQYQLVLTTASGEEVDFRNETDATGDNVFNFINQELVYTITDLCSGSICWGNIVLEDKTPPTLECDCPVGGEGGVYSPECTLTCYDVSLLEGPDNLPSDIDDFVNNSIEDNCFNYSVVNVSFEDDLSDFGMCGNSLLRRTWTIVYTANNSNEQESISCTREYAFMPLDLSTAILTDGPVTSPLDHTVYLPVRAVEIPCVAMTTPAAIAALEGDAYGHPHIYVGGTAVGLDGSVCNITSTYSDRTTDGCAEGCLGNSKILRSWTVLDWCTSELLEFLQVIKLEDSDGPLLSLVEDQSIAMSGNRCEMDYTIPAPLILGDFCDSLATYNVTGTSGDHSIVGNMATGFTAIDLGVGTHEIYFTAEDCCGNVSFDTLTVSIKDETSPNAIAEEFIAITVHSIDDDEVFGLVTAAAIDNGSYDNCSAVTLEVRRMDGHCNTLDTDWGNAVHFCCADMNESGWAEVEVELRVTDDCGNFNTVRSKVQIQDKSMDELTCPEGMMMTCGESIDDLTVTGVPSGSGSCGSLDLDYETIISPASKPANEKPLFDYDNDGIDDMVPPYDSICGYGAMRREFREGSTVICTQYFVFTAPDILDPNTIAWPADVTLDCSSAVIEEPRFTTPSCSSIQIAVESDTFPEIENFCYAIRNTWTVVDWCLFDQTNGDQGKYTHVQNVKVSDDTAPVINVAADMVFDLAGTDCNLDNVSIPVSASDSDNCASEALSWTVAIDYFNDGVVDAVQTFESITGDTLNLQLSDVPATKSGHLLSWSTTDACGNEGVTTSIIRVIDRTVPIPYCVGVTTAIDTSDGTFELWAIDFNGGASDNCTEQAQLRFTFSSTEPPIASGYYEPVTGAAATLIDFEEGRADSWNTATQSAGRIFTEDDLNIEGAVTLAIYVWDECGNNDFCLIQPVIKPRLVGSRATIQGRYTTENGLSIDEVSTSIANVVTGSQSAMMSDEDGVYAFQDNPMHNDYIIKGQKDIDYLNGVSTLDLIQIQRHVLGQRLLDSPYKIIAADVNGDRQLNGSDLVELRKLILGITDTLVSNSSWKFIDKSQGLDLYNPWNYRDSLTITNLESEMMEENFIGVKVGDVDNTNIPNGFSSKLEGRADNLMELRFADRDVQVGEELTVQFTTSETEIYGYQLGLEFDGLKVVAVNASDIAEENIHLTGSSLRLSYNNDYIRSSDAYLLELTLVAEKGGSLSSMIDLGTTVTSEAYVGKFLELKNIQLVSNLESAYRLYQNRPNPFLDKTTIEFEIPVQGEVLLTFYDITGKIIKEIFQDFEAGQHAVEVNKRDLGTTGIIYYRLASGGFTSMKQMIILE